MAGYSIRSGSGDEESSEESDEEDEGAVVVGVPSNVDKHGSKISVVPKEAAVPADAVKDDAENEKAPSKKVRRRYIDGDAVLALAKKPFNGQSDIIRALWRTIRWQMSIVGRNIKNIVRTAQALAVSQ